MFVILTGRVCVHVFQRLLISNTSPTRRGDCSHSPVKLLAAFISRAALKNRNKSTSTITPLFGRLESILGMLDESFRYGDIRLLNVSRR